MGVPGPEPSFIFGNLLEIKRRPPAPSDEEEQEAADVSVIQSGFYNGAIPFLLVADIDLLKKIELEDSDAFLQRGNVFEIEPLPDYRHKMIVTAPVSRWREMRAVLSPAFTISKLSQMFVIMDKCSDTMMEKLEEKRRAATSVEVTSTFRRATIDTMFKAGYGVDLKVQDSPPGGFFDELGKGADQLLRSVPLCGVSFLSNCFPEFYHFWYLLSWLTSRLAMPYVKLTTLLISPILNERKTLNLRERADVLQLLLNKESRGQLSLREGHGFDGKTKLALTKDEVAANSAFYLIAGMEATPNTMGMTLHLIARHPEVQDKLRAEILRVLKRDGKFTQRNVSEMTYLDMVLNESMRFYPGVVG
ncbi:cytochrome P450 3A24 [Rhipicephalus sanguineus]|uniref:cytochrome P450 3A24 n=1 Tax=Rhipicephalus sanguineus TaxID=34632 RepID=UPI0020C58AE3|nr:cytochrome P450 3A24 [Rhipicephalus sanguineus]